MFNYWTITKNNITTYMLKICLILEQKEVILI